MQSQTPEEIVNRWQGAVYNLAKHMLGNEADAADATQNVFMTLFQDLKQYDPARPWEPWLYKLATNVILKFARSEQRARNTKTRFAGEQLGNQNEKTPGENMSDEEIALVLGKQLQALPEEERLILLLHYYIGKSLADIAEWTGEPKSTVQSKMERGLGRLRSLMEKAGCFGVLALLTEKLQALPAQPFPATLRKNLLALAKEQSVLAGSAAGTFGGFKLFSLLCLCLLSGFGSAWLLKPAEEVEKIIHVKNSENKEPKMSQTFPTLGRMVIAATKVDAMAEFYAKTFGAKLVKQSWGEIQFYDGSLAGVDVRFFPAGIAGITASDNRHQLEFEVEDPRAALDIALRHGGTLDEGAQVAEDQNIISVSPRDPDGNSITLYRRKKK